MCCDALCCTVRTLIRGDDANLLCRVERHVVDGIDLREAALVMRYKNLRDKRTVSDVRGGRVNEKKSDSK